MAATAQEGSGTAERPDTEGQKTHFWRLELSGGPGVYSGKAHRSGDWMTKVTVEYETPMTERLTLGLRLLPALLYEQDGRGEETVWGGGAGVAARLYAKPEGYRGLFGEASGHLVVHKHQIEGNTSNLNFLTGLGLGYQFENDLSAVIRWEHLSNAHLGHHNQGANMITAGIGIRF